MKKKCCSEDLNDQEAKDLLTSNGLNRTKTKIGILTSLSHAVAPLSVADIHHHLGDQSCDVSTVFRAMVQFKEKGIVKEVNLGEDFFRYELINNDHHHHHIRCRQCGDIKLIDQCDLSLIEKMISKLGYKNLDHHLEFTGLCSKCGQ